MLLSSIDFAIIIVYLLIVLCAGFWFALRKSTANQFMDGGRSMSGWMVGLSVFGTQFSSIIFLAQPASAFATNWSALVMELIAPFAVLLVVRYFIPFYRKEGNISAYEHLGRKFGGWATVFAVTCYTLLQLARIAVIMYLVALALTPLTGWDERWVVIVTGLVVTAYTYMGGIESVIWTDSIQSIMLILGGVMCAIFIMFSMPEGPMQVFDIAVTQQKFGLGAMNIDFVETTFWVLVISGFFMKLDFFGIDQSCVQRYIVAKSEKEAKRSVWLAVWLGLFISALFCFIGTALFAFYHAQPELAGTAVPAALKSDSILPYFVATQMPAGTIGFLIAAIIAAAMSSIDSGLNSSATLFYTNIYKTYVSQGQEVSDKEAKLVLHGASLILGLIGIGVALAMMNIEGILFTWLKILGVLSGGTLGLFILSRVTETRKMAAMSGVALAVVLLAWITFSKNWTGSWEVYKCPLNTLMSTVVSSMTILFVGLAGSLLKRKRRRDSDLAEASA
ncbi:MAG: sodium:solute symporter [Verrucomicrobia bacterium CG_4_10_14_3_um_filter_43_23]|nr:MAG: hypothetical protein AUJ82_05270 [Verrucomicrobia bacterium CG1_02_43_26]PIP58738.1 MAG: sodium:solute symporter [Verrucomicrobia bacterium CG22_combo_CG10-13_8_21_14_all_43_17]PIX58025.1 MAG: sodium:solute symporter [Verrucomicrobia bacterium CG_4_10_14_3_um_filter_43_23]PIY61551.1 MAG: sodium:solute symporter [Verrucomicrobia bacterium CG_4_10_14_0_8_um_filter_43_34]PJA43471.1 MAG: sodium:solute symporter [Verrucomicrobia bacterium CG_4_9_14_3_um_filter_43_20]